MVQSPLPSNRLPSVQLSAIASSAIDWEIVKADALSTPTTELMLEPGAQGDIAVLLKNESHQPLQVYLSIRGTFPAMWFVPDEPWLQETQDQLQFNSLPFTLAPLQTLYKTLSFKPPENFFEEVRALSEQNKTLTLQYANELYLYHRLPSQIPPEEEELELTEQEPADSDQTLPPRETVRLIGHQPFKLYARPNRAYLQFLPEIYQQSDFLGRFLGICEQVFEPTYEATENFWAYLDPLTAPRALLPFLAHWVAWPMNARWTLRQQRRLIRHAVEIYQWRGTRRGLQLCLHLCTDLPLDDQHIEITEADEAGFILGDIALSTADEATADEVEDTEDPLEDPLLSINPTLGGGLPCHFSVTLRPETLDQANQLEETMLREIIEQEKPAFCTYDLTIESVINSPINLPEPVGR